MASFVRMGDRPLTADRTSARPGAAPNRISFAISLAANLVIAATLVGCVAAPVAPGPTQPTSIPAPPSTVSSPLSQPQTDDATPVLVGTVVSVTDGDTIRVQLSSGPIRVRFQSIDAPEHDQPWGQEARAALASRLDGRRVALEVETQDRYERLVATVYLGDENINAWMVQEGHAWAYREYLKDPQFCQSEADARTRHLGLWSLGWADTYAPWEWRAHKKDPSRQLSDYRRETAADCVAAMHGRRAPIPRKAPPPPAPNPPAPSDGCLIKGNISQSGRIYHLPGSPSYDQTKIDESKGERWFCSETEARAAGWRTAR